MCFPLITLLTIPINHEHETGFESRPKTLTSIESFTSRSYQRTIFSDIDFHVGCIEIGSPIVSIYASL